MNKPPSYPHFAQDWIAGTAHLSVEAQGAYQRLLDHEWVGGPWVGPLTEDHDELARLLGFSRAKFERIWRSVGKHFLHADGGGLYNDRLERERQIQEGFRAVKSLSGKAGAEARWHQGKDGRRHAAAISLPMAGGMANDGLSSSPSTPPTEISVESRREGRRSTPQPIGELLGKSQQQSVHRFRRVQAHEAP